MSEHDGNITFKCNYNDGGDRGFVGFYGTCSDGNIHRNVKTKRPWCSNPHNACRQFHDRNFTGKRPCHPCYESQIFQRWRFGTGVYHKEQGSGKSIPMQQAKKGKVALLTTRLPERDEEAERIVFAAYKIDRIRVDDNGMKWIEGSAVHTIRLSENNASALPYWNFKQGKRRWGTGLFRYISDQEVTNFLHALKPHLQSPQDRVVLEHLLECCGNLEPETCSGG